jgi:hypothetical protein
MKVLTLLQSWLRRARERVWGRPPPEFDRAVEELGGVPWRAFGATERWYLPVADEGPVARPGTVDSAALVLARPPLLGRAWRWLGGASAAVLALVVLVALVGGSTPAAAVVATPPAPAVAPSPVAPPPVATPSVAPTPKARVAAAGRKISPSVQALFSAKGKASAKHAAKKKRGRRR